MKGLTLHRAGLNRVAGPVAYDRRRETCLLLFAVMFMLVMSQLVLTTRADNFTDVFYTSGFRGSFEWIRKLDWVGVVVQCVISTFALIGTALIVLRIMTSMLFLSAKGLWEEVHDLKQSGGGESEFYDFGMLNIAKTWAKGKAGTGLDAIFGAVLVLLPDVKRYSDFGEKSGQKFEEDVSIAQYMLKIALPTVLSIFFLAMAFNGTLMKGIAVSVDALGEVADRAVSVNYAGFVEDLVNTKSGYNFVAANDGTKLGEYQTKIQNDVYGRVVAKISNPTPAQLFAVGQKVESIINREELISNASNSMQVQPNIRGNLNDAAENDKYWGYMAYRISESGGTVPADRGMWSIPLSSFVTELGVDLSGDAVGAGDEISYVNQNIIISFEQDKTYTGTKFNLDDVARES